MLKVWPARWRQVHLGEMPAPGKAVDMSGGRAALRIGVLA